ncbi:MAG: class I SAM-dependent methyltransferase [Chlamydiota bacterium]
MPYNEKIPGWMPKKDLTTLETLAKRVPENGSIVEVGSYQGRSSWALAKSCHPSVEVCCIDLWNDSFIKEQFIENTKDCPNIHSIQSGSTEVDWPEDKKVDLVFIDADHTSPQVDKDLAFWSKRVKAKGTLSGHDMDVASWPDVCRAVLNLSEELQIPFKVNGTGLIWWIDYDPTMHPDFGSEANEVIIDWIKELTTKK